MHSPFTAAIITCFLHFQSVSIVSTRSVRSLAQSPAVNIKTNSAATHGVFSRGQTIPSGFVLPKDLVLPNSVVLIQPLIFKEGTVLPAGTTLPLSISGSAPADIPLGIPFQRDYIVNTAIIIPEFYPLYTTVVLPAGYIFSQDYALPSQVSLPFAIETTAAPQIIALSTVTTSKLGTTTLPFVPAEEQQPVAEQGGKSTNEDETVETKTLEEKTVDTFIYISLGTMGMVILVAIGVCLLVCRKMSQDQKIASFLETTEREARKTTLMGIEAQMKKFEQITASRRQTIQLAEAKLTEAEKRLSQIEDKLKQQTSTERKSMGPPSEPFVDANSTLSKL